MALPATSLVLNVTATLPSTNTYASWGDNSRGQLGPAQVNPGYYSTVPLQLTQPTPVAAISGALAAGFVTRVRPGHRHTVAGLDWGYTLRRFYNPGFETERGGTGHEWCKGVGWYA